MADIKSILNLVVTDQTSKLSDFAIGDKQIIFIQDRRKIALDYNGKRTFYNQIEILQTESERQELIAPENGAFYFVIGTASLWFYKNEWTCITSPPQEIVFIGEILPELGSENTLYVSNEENNEHISIWDKTTQRYITVADKTQSISEEEINSLFII